VVYLWGVQKPGGQVVHGFVAEIGVDQEDEVAIVVLVMEKMLDTWVHMKGPPSLQDVDLWKVCCWLLLECYD